MKKIALIIPCYNAENFIEKCVESVFCDDFSKQCQVIIIDDGSKDESPKILDILAQKYENLEVIHQANAGASAARNAALKLVDSEYISFLDSDDLLCVNGLKELYELANKNAADIAVGNYIELCGDNERKIKTFATFSENALLDKTAFFRAFCAREANFCVWAKIYKSELISKNNIEFFEGVFLAEDLCFNAQAMFFASKIVKSSAVVVKYRIGDNNASKKPNERHFTDKQKVGAKLENFIANKPLNDDIKSLKALILRIKHEDILNLFQDFGKYKCKNLNKALFDDGFALLSKRLKVQILLRVFLGQKIYNFIFSTFRKFKQKL